MHPQEQQLEGRGEEPPIRLGMGKGGVPGIWPRPSQKDDDGKRGGLLWGLSSHGTTRSRKAHPATRAGKGAVGGGHGRTERERERGRIGHHCTGGGGDSWRTAQGGRHHRGDETSRGRRHREHPRLTGATRTRAHACDAAGAGALGGVGGGEVRARLRLRVGFRLCQLRLERGALVAKEGRYCLLSVEISLLQCVAAELT